MTAPILIFAIGNESRGDDALAPLLVRELEAHLLEAGLQEQVEMFEEYQLQIENATDLVGRSVVLFVDADVSCAEPFDFSEISAAKNDSYTTHAMKPPALLHVYRKVYGVDPPPAFLLCVRGQDFALGEPLSEQAAANLERAATRVREWLADIQEMVE
jgi:hydrogenase maturation protease